MNGIQWNTYREKYRADVSRVSPDHKDRTARSYTAEDQKERKR